MFLEMKYVKRLIKRGNSYCLTIPAMWIKETKVGKHGYNVRLIIKNNTITIYPDRSDVSDINAELELKTTA